MNNVRTVLLFVFAVGTILAAVAWTQSPAHAEGHLMVLPADLKWSDAPSLPPSAKIAVIEGDLKTPVPFMFRLKVPAGGKIGVHTHPVVEHLTVISGTFNLGIGDTFDPAKATPLGAEVSRSCLPERRCSRIPPRKPSSRSMGRVRGVLPTSTWPIIQQTSNRHFMGYSQGRDKPEACTSLCLAPTTHRGGHPPRWSSKPCVSLSRHTAPQLIGLLS
jgi:hypothetical protein